MSARAKAVSEKMCLKAVWNEWRCDVDAWYWEHRSICIGKAQWVMDRRKVAVWLAVDEVGVAASDLELESF